MYKETRQEFPNRNTYFTDSDKRVYIDIRRSKGYTGEFKRVNQDDSDLSITINLKAAAAKKMRLHVTGYFQGEYMYMLGKDGLIMNYKRIQCEQTKNCYRIVSDAHKTIRQKKKNKLFWFWEKKIVKKRDITKNKKAFFYYYWHKKNKKATLQKTKRLFFFIITGIKPLSTQQKN